MKQRNLQSRMLVSRAFPLPVLAHPPSHRQPHAEPNHEWQPWPRQPLAKQRPPVRYDILSQFLPSICPLTPAPPAYTFCTPRNPNTPSTKMQFQSTTSLPTSATPLPFLITTNTTGTGHSMAANQLLKKSGSAWIPKPGTLCCSRDSITPSKRIATRILNGAPVQFNPIPINVAATGTLLLNSSFSNDV